MLKTRNKKGQSTLEYIILVTAVIVVILALVFSDSSPFRTNLNQTYSTMLDGSQTLANKLANTYTGTI